jgi:DNA-binding transcriptional LysR family regulator
MDLGEIEEDLSALVTHKLLDDEVRLAVPQDHPLAKQGVAHMSDFSSEEWIAGCPRCRRHLLSLAGHAGFAPNVAFETEDYVAVLGLVRAGLGVALVPDLILNAAKPEDVVALPLEPASRRQILAVTTPDLQRVPAVHAALRALCEAAGVPAPPLQDPRTPAPV